VSDAVGRRTILIELPLGSDEELAALKGALLAARATERSQSRRRNDRLSFGYGSDSARDTMNDEVDLAERRVAMLDRLLVALDEATAVDER
jgi:hypothetical protein